MKRSLYFLLAALCVVMSATAANAAKVREFSAPQWLCANTNALSITHVAFTDTATVLSFHATYQPNNWIRIPRSTYLLGENGKQYAVRSGKGITVGEEFYMPASGEADFKVLFEPLPKRTRFFDYFEGNAQNSWAILGIHDKAKPIKMKQPKEAFRWTADLEREFFKADTIHLCGRIKGYTPAAGFKTLQTYLNNPITNEDTPRSISVNADGTFSLRLPASYPMLLPVIIQSPSYNKFYSIYCVPGQTSEVVLSPNGALEYVQQPGGGFACHNALRHGYEDWIHKFFPDYYRLSDSGEPLADIVADAQSKLESAMKFVDYQAWRFDYSPWERHLAETFARLQMNWRVMGHVDFLDRFFWSDADTTGVDVEAIKKELAAPESYAFMRKLPDNDPAMFIHNNLDGILNRYEFSPLLWEGKSNKVNIDPQSAEAADCLMAVADKQIFGREKPSLYLEMALVRDFGSDINLRFWKSEEAWKTVYESKRKYISHPHLRAELDRLYERQQRTADLVQPLPHTPAAYAFRRILDKYQGKYVMVDFWGMNCGPCRAGIQHSLEMRKELRNHPDIEFVFINAAGESSPEDYKEYVDKYLDGEEVYEVSRDEYNQFMELFSFLGIPHYEFFDRNGNRINENAHLHYDSTAEQFLKSQLEPLIEKLEK